MLKLRALYFTVFFKITSDAGAKTNVSSYALMSAPISAVPSVFFLQRHSILLGAARSDGAATEEEATGTTGEGEGGPR